MCLQVLSDRLPFHHMRFPATMCAILRGERPGKPLNASDLGLADALWELLQSCWSESALVRPTARQLFDYLRPASVAWVLPPMACPPTRGRVVGADTLISDLSVVSSVSLSGPACLVQ
jgi:hypothetical protein